jgi:serine/threonine protein kinase/lipoprotein NlpI
MTVDVPAGGTAQAEEDTPGATIDAPGEKTPAPGGNDRPQATVDAPTGRAVAADTYRATIDVPGGRAAPAEPFGATIDAPSGRAVAAETFGPTIDTPGGRALPPETFGATVDIPAPPTGAAGGDGASPPSSSVHGTHQRRFDATMAPPPGAHPPVAPEMRSGRYVLKKFHAKGGMGEIWLAEDGEIGRPVALKKMRGKPRPEKMDEFLREAQITGQLEHPGVVPIHELGTDEAGQPFYTMKFIQGRTLSQVIDEYHAPPGPGAAPREVQCLRLLQIFLNLCQTVAYAHSRHVIHRDLKPDNVMVGAYGETLLLDWGLAKPLGVPEETADTPEAPVRTRFSYSGESLETMDGAVKGTPAYMAPEVAEGRVADIDQSSDIFLLGGTLYHILTGKKPRAAKTVTEYIKLASTKPPPPPRTLDRTIPKALDAICVKALALRREDRYASAAALAEDVQRYLAGEPATAYRENFWERSWRWVKRHRVALGRVAVLLVVLGMSGVGVAMVREAEAQREADRVENVRRLQLAEERRLAQQREDKLKFELAEERRKAERAEEERKQIEAARKLKQEAEQRQKAEHEAAESKRTIQARAQVERFRGLADEAQHYAAFQDPGAEHVPYFDLEKGEEKALAALALVGPWGPHLEGLPLEEERTPLRAEVYDLLLLTARTKSRRAQPGTPQEMLALLDRAAALREPTVSCYRLRADAYRLAGDKDKADAAQRQADDPATPAIALDHFLAAEQARTEHTRQAAEPLKEQGPAKREQLTRAVELYRKALALQQKHFWSHFQLGHCYLALGQGDLAVEALGACVALRPDSPLGYTMRGLVLGLQKRYAAAVADLDRAVALDADFRPARLNRGLVNWLEKKYDAALADFEAVLRPPAEQRLLEAAFYRGQLHLERGEPARALADFSLAVADKRGVHAAYLRRARLYFAGGDVRRGLADVDAYLAHGRAPALQSAEGLAQRGRQLRTLAGELQGAARKNLLLLAVADLQKAADLGHRSLALFDNLGAAREDLGRVRAAIEAYTEAVKLSPKEARLLVKRGWAHERLGQLDEALADFAAALRLDPAHAEAHAGLGYIQACRGQAAAGASRHASEAVLYQPGDYLLLHNVACVYGKLSERDPKRQREYEDLALTYLRREVELWQKDRSGPNPIPLIRGEPAFPPALRERPEFQKLIGGAP